jgi:LemA protein
MSASSVVLIIAIAIAGWAVLGYNSLVSLRNQVQNAWRQIDVQLRRRHDLIPNLVEAVKGYMQFERDTLTQVVEARAKAISAPDQASRMAAENQITGGLGRLLAVMENYPQLKSDQNVLKLRSERAQAPGGADHHRESDRVFAPGLQRLRDAAQHAYRKFPHQSDRQ